jgi:ABC-type transport system substrate-binding protein
MVLYALHDALVKPMPGQLLAPSLAESWSAAKDGLSHDFVLREGVTFHNGEPVTTDDVKFSFERYRGTSHDTLKSHTASVDVLDQRHVRFRMKEPWPDFMPFTVPPPERPGSCQGNIWKRSATMVSKGPRSAPAPTGSSRLPPGSSWWPRRSIGTGARRPTSSAC